MAESLEARLLLFRAAPTDGVLDPTGLPLLHSLPGAPAAIFLDFDGLETSYTPYDTDGDPSGYGPSEQDAVRGAWQHVASDFSMFNVDVTTEQPTAAPYSYSIISNSVTGGSFNQGFFPSAVPTNIHPSSEVVNRPTVFAHEIGHSFRLQHQSVYDERGGKLAEYHPGYDAFHGAIMGVDTAQPVTKWFIGHPSTSPATLQDDVATIAGVIATLPNGGDGFRPDDYPDVPGAAATLAPGVGGTFTTTGIVERLSDADAFSFVNTGAAVQIGVVPPRPSMLDPKLEVYSAGGTLLGGADGPTNDEHLTMALAPGKYVVVVRSHGDYADLGPYDLSVAPAELPEEPFDPAVPVLAKPDASATSPGRVTVAWAPVAGAAGYALERSEDGAAWKGLTAADADHTTFVDAPPLAGHRYFYRVRTLSTSGRSAPSVPASALTHPSTPTELSVTTLPGAFVLNWRDLSSETGYRIERQTELAGGNVSGFFLIGRVDANVPSMVDRSLADGTRYRYHVIAENPSGGGEAAEAVASTPTVELPGLRVNLVTSNYVALTWGPILGATRYELQRSRDDVHYDTVTTVTGLEVVDTSVAPARQYFYRVTGTTDTGQRVTSQSVVAVTRGTAVDGWSVTDIGIDPAGATARSPVALTPGPSYDMLGSGDGLAQTTGTGAGTGRSSDSLRYVFKSLPGDGAITARISYQDSVPASGMAGIMIREGTDPGARYVFAGVSPRLGMGSMARTSAGARSSNFVRAGDAGPRWLRIIRAGPAFTVYTFEQDRWRPLMTYGVSMNLNVQAALVACAGDSAHYSAVTFDNVTVTRGEVFVAELPAASPEVVEWDQTELSVLGYDTHGEDKLSYTWSAAVLPPDTDVPRFSNNGTNDAKRVTATFSGAGHYVLQVRIANGGGFSITGTVAVEVVQRPSDVRIEPAPRPVHTGAAARFTAVALDQFGHEIRAPADGTPVEWSAWLGAIDEGGNYTAPADAGWERVTATVGGAWNSADVYVYDDSAAVLLSAVSRKVHGRRGAVDLPLALYGAPTVVEPRRGGPTTLLFEFSRNVTPVDGALGADDFNIANATFRSAHIDGKVLTLEVAAVRDDSVVSVSLARLTDVNGNGLLGDAEVDVRALCGDVDRDGQVTRADVLELRGRLMRPSGVTDLLFDVDLSGSITSADVLLARRRIGRGAP